MRIEEEFEFDTEEEAKKWLCGAIAALNFSGDEETDLESYTRMGTKGESIWGFRMFRDIEGEE